MVRTIDNRILGLNIAYYRKLRRLTQAELADKIHISLHYMSRIECGNVSKCVSLPVLNSIAGELGVSIDVLLSKDDSL